MGTLLAYIPIGPIGGCPLNADCPNQTWWQIHPVPTTVAAIVLAAALGLVLAKIFKNLKPSRRIIAMVALAVLGIVAAYWLINELQPCYFDGTAKACLPDPNISCESPYVCRPVAVAFAPLLIPVALVGAYCAATLKKARTMKRVKS